MELTVLWSKRATQGELGAGDGCGGREGVTALWRKPTGDAPNVACIFFEMKLHSLSSFDATWEERGKEGRNEETIFSRSAWLRLVAAERTRCCAVEANLLVFQHLPAGFHDGDLYARKVFHDLHLGRNGPTLALCGGDAV